MKKIILSSFAAITLTVAGCSMFGTNPTPPGAFERKYFDVSTNLVQQGDSTVEQIVLTPKESVIQATQAAGSVSNFVIPGSGGLVAGILGTLAVWWAKARSGKK